MEQTNQNTSSIKVSDYELKLPSADVVTSDSLWDCIVGISATSDKFTQEQLKANFKSSLNTIKRVLSYLKYLGYISETRAEETQNGKKNLVQYFTLNKEIPSVNGIQYDIKAKRLPEAKEKWYAYIKEHPISQIISSDFFGSSEDKTRIDLENFLKGRPGLAGKNPSYYQNGVTFICKLLSGANVISVNGNNIKKLGLSSAVASPDPNHDEDSKKEEKVRTGNQDVYTVTISGPDHESSIAITDSFDIEIIEKILEKLKKQFPVPGK